MTKWFVTDMDGTFLDDDKKISPHSKSVIKRLKDKGIKFIIATGRADIAVKNYYNEMGLEDLTISCNGSFIRNQKTGEIIYEKHLNMNEIKIIHDTYLKNTDGTVEFHLYTPNYIYCDKCSNNIKRIRKYEKINNAKYKTPVIIEKDVISSIEKNNDKCYKVMIYSDNKRILEEIFDKIKEKIDVEGRFSADNFFDISSKGTSKSNGIQKVADYYNLKIEDAIAFGDGFNDIDMLEMVGKGICPINAKKEIRDICDEVIGSNNDYSILKYMEDYLNKIGEEYEK